MKSDQKLIIINGKDRTDDCTVQCKGYSHVLAISLW